MKKIKLGHTGEMVSAFCLGAMCFGTRQVKDEAFALIDQFAKAGGDSIDTANIYAHFSDHSYFTPITTTIRLVTVLKIAPNLLFFSALMLLHNLDDNISYLRLLNNLDRKANNSS